MTDTTFTRHEHEAECQDRRQTMREYVCLKLKPINKQLTIYWVILFLFITGLLGGNYWSGSVNAKQSAEIKNNKESMDKVEKAFIMHHKELVSRLDKLETRTQDKLDKILEEIR